jgi:hypothetical protein
MNRRASLSRSSSPSSVSSAPIASRPTSLHSVESISSHPLGDVGSPPPTYTINYAARRRPIDIAITSESPGPSLPATEATVVTSSKATFKLQTQSLQATVQRDLGLTNDSAGWAILQKLIQPSATDTLWTNIVRALTKGNAALLLPKEPLAPSEPITSAFLADHCVISEGAPKADEGASTCVATLSGLRASIDGCASLADDPDESLIAYRTRTKLDFASVVPIPGDTGDDIDFVADTMQRCDRF